MLAEVFVVEVAAVVDFDVSYIWLFPRVARDEGSC